MPTLELTCEQISKPALQKGDDAAQEEKPNSPAWRPKANARTLTNRAGIESVVNQMLQVLAHSNLPHQTILVPVHACELTNVVESILQTIRVLIGIDISKSELHMSINNELGETQYLSRQVECIAKSRLLSFLGGQSFGRLQVEIWSKK